MLWRAQNMDQKLPSNQHTRHIPRGDTTTFCNSDFTSFCASMSQQQTVHQKRRTPFKRHTSAFGSLPVILERMICLSVAQARLPCSSRRRHHRHLVSDLIVPGLTDCARTYSISFHLGFLDHGFCFVVHGCLTQLWSLSMSRFFGLIDHWTCRRWRVLPEASIDLFVNLCPFARSVLVGERFSNVLGRNAVAADAIAVSVSVAAAAVAEDLHLELFRAAAAPMLCCDA